VGYPVKKIMTTVFLSGLLFGCATQPQSNQVVESQSSKQNQVSERDLHSYAKELAISMFETMPRLNSSNRIAVGSFLPLMNLTEKNDENLVLLSGQLQASFQTLFSQVGASVIEYRASEQIILADKYDVMLTRDTELLASNLSIDYFLTGTISPVEKGYLVNARLIDSADKRIISAATQLIPAHVNWRNNKLSLRNGMLHRSTY
jgi:TolB-like protein